MDYIFRYCSIKFLVHALPEPEEDAVSLGEVLANPNRYPFVKNADPLVIVLVDMLS